MSTPRAGGAGPAAGLISLSGAVGRPRRVHGGYSAFVIASAVGLIPIALIVGAFLLEVPRGRRRVALRHPIRELLDRGDDGGEAEDERDGAPVRRPAPR